MQTFFVSEFIRYCLRQTIHIINYKKEKEKHNVQKIN